jgi:predicted phage terminase large subunit-like protein
MAKKKSDKKDRQKRLKRVENLLSYQRLLRGKKGLQDLYFFNREVLEKDYPKRQKNIVPHVHGEWWEWYKNSESRLKMILVPRGTLKSTFFTVGGTLQMIAQDPDSRILIANATLGNAQKFVGEVKMNIQKNENFRELYGDFYNPDGKWTESEIAVKKRSRGVREPTVTAVGVGGNLVSQHYSHIWWDDLVNEQNVFTRDQALKVIEWWQKSLSLLDPDGTGVIIGTRWSHFELYQHILDELEDEVDIFIRSAYNEDGSTYYPELLSQKKLAQLRRLEGSYTFSAFYLNNPVDEESSLIKRSEIHYWGGECPCGRRHRKPVRGELSVFVTCDPAFSQSSQADFSAIATVGVDNSNGWWVLETAHGKWRTNELIDRLFDTYDRWKPDAMSLEAMSAAQGMIQPLQEEMDKRGVYMPIREIKSRVISNKQAKFRAILQPRFQQGKVFVHSSQEELVDELIRYPRSKHDDLLDALTDVSEIGFPPDRDIDIEDKKPVTMEERFKAKLDRMDDDIYDDPVFGDWW